ncbi:MAG: preprotein translocase subunit YajC [Clostridiales bacterium]|nr:preprotein translocase subunit YajC [Clostridiales bacterium]MCR5274461.1 preprotein translocase subunit YajC [Clostridiales bacterium]
MVRYLLDAGTADAQAGGGGSALIMVAIFAVFIILWYVIALRPQRKKEKELRAKVDKMRPGDTVITIGGLVGKVANIRDDEVTIMTSAANTLVTFKKNAINTVVSRDAKPEAAKTADSKEEKKSDKIVLKKKEKAETEEAPAAETVKEETDLGEIKE